MTLQGYVESHGEVLTHCLYTLQFPPFSFFCRILGLGAIAATYTAIRKDENIISSKFTKKTCLWKVF